MTRAGVKAPTNTMKRGQPAILHCTQILMTMLGQAEASQNSVGEAANSRILFQRETERVCCDAVAGPSRSKPGLDLCVCKPNSLGASLNSGLKRKFPSNTAKRFAGVISICKAPFVLCCENRRFPRSTRLRFARKAVAAKLLEKAELDKETESGHYFDYGRTTEWRIADHLSQ
jgi:hypothetical protein